MINVIGLGYIGLPTALMFATHGVEVIGTDLNKELVETLRADKTTFKEEGLDDLFSDALKAGITFTTEYQPTDTYIVSVPTPYDKDSKKIDPTYVVNAVEQVLDVAPFGAVVVIESTVSPGTIDKYVRPVVEEKGLSVGIDIHLVHAPERIIPGNMVSELTHNNRTIGADDEEIGERIKNLYSSFCQGEIAVTDIRTAEMTKVVENTFRDINIAFANELAKICRSDDMDVYEIIRIANKHPRVNILTPGPGVGGHCIAVDPWFIHEKFEDITPLIYEARLVNDGKPAWTADRIARDVKPGAKIAVLGMSFKANIDDTRESPSVLFANILKSRGYEVLACEPYIQGDVAGYHNYSLAEAMAQCEYAVITLMHNVFKENKALIASRPYYDCVGLMEQ